MIEDLRKSQDKNKPTMSINQKDIRCPIHNCLIGKYDARVGICNATFYCHKCGIEYTFTIKAQK